MRSVTGILILLVACTSCSSFNKLHYRHLKKVPAQPQNYVLNLKEEFHSELPAIPAEENKESTWHETTDTLLTVFEIPGAIDHDATHEESVVREINYPPVAIIPPVSARRDWSVGIALLMILAGILIILYCIFILPYFNIFLILILALELLCGFAALKLIAKGVSIIRNRVRKPKSYKESGNQVK